MSSLFLTFLNSKGKCVAARRIEVERKPTGEYRLHRSGHAKRLYMAKLRKLGFGHFYREHGVVQGFVGGLSTKRIVRSLTGKNYLGV